MFKFLALLYACLPSYVYVLIYLSYQNTEQQVQGVLNLIDLAGSERLSRSGATGDRLKETQVFSS